MFDSSRRPCMKFFIFSLIFCFASFSHSKNPFASKAKKCEQALTQTEENVALKQAQKISTKNLVNAIQKNDANQFNEVLKDSNLDVNQGDRNGTPPLYLAVQLNRLEMALKLIKAGADVNTGNPVNGKASALHVAAKKGHHDLVVLLVEHGAHLNAVTSYGESPLHWAAETLQHGIIRWLAQKGAKIQKNHFQENPLHIVALSLQTEGKLETYQALMDAGANPNAKNQAGQTPFEIEEDKLRPIFAILEPDNRVPIEQDNSPQAN